LQERGKQAVRQGEVEGGDLPDQIDPWIERSPELTDHAPNLTPDNETTAVRIGPAWGTAQTYVRSTASKLRDEALGLGQRDAFIGANTAGGQPDARHAHDPTGPCASSPILQTARRSPDPSNPVCGRSRQAREPRLALVRATADLVR